MNISDLKLFAESNDIKMANQSTIASEAADIITKRYNYSLDAIKINFDKLLYETERET